MNIKNSVQAYNESRKYIPGGVNSPVRAFKSVGGSPLFISHAKGSRIYDIDGNEFLDFCMSWGAIILGHADPDVTAPLRAVLEKGTSYGCPTIAETDLAKMICDAIPSIEKIRFVNSGTEAVMSAIRLARAYTRKAKIIKFDGCYHGHADYLLSKTGSGVAHLPESSSLGVTGASIADTISLPYNDTGTLKDIVKKHYKEIACVIIEPVAANMGLVFPKKGFLEELRKITKHFGVLLIFDEVITGFRVHYGGVQDIYSVKPDITCLGKIIGGGFPVGAFGGKREIMDMLAPEGGVYQAGTLSGNPMAMNAGLEVLKRLKKRGFYKDMELKRKLLIEKLGGIAGIYIHSIGSMYCIFFSDKKVRNFQDVKQCDTKRYKNYFWNMLEKGIYIVPSQFETNFFSNSHTEADIRKFIESVKETVKK